jgi:hypothetical protein
VISTKTFTCIAICPECKAELFKQSGIKQKERFSIIYDMPSKALCAISDHNTFSDNSQNYGMTITWYLEKKRNRDGKILKLVKEPSNNPYED